VDAREQYENLSPAQQARVDEILGPEMARGWVPKDADIQAAIAVVLREDSLRDSATSGTDTGSDAGPS